MGTSLEPDRPDQLLPGCWYSDVRRVGAQAIRERKGEEEEEEEEEEGQPGTGLMQ